MDSLVKIIVTGCNKGIGYGIIENLFQKPYKIIMACRNLKLAQEAKEKLEKEFPQAKGELHPMELDITKEESMDQFIKQFSEKFNQVDILLNNAGVLIRGDAFDEKVAAYTLGANFFGTLKFTQKVFYQLAYIFNQMTPLVRKNGKIIIVSSQGGKLTSITKDSLRNDLLSEDMTIEKLLKYGEQFIEGAKSMEYENQGWARSCYYASKILINIFGKVYSKDKQILENGIQVYTLCPGWAETPVYLAELPFEINPDFQGKFFFDKKVISLV